MADTDQGGVQFGEPLTFYSRGEETWPAAWKLPEREDDDGDLFCKMAWLADDLILRQAVHVWDNAMRAPGTIPGISGGMLSAHARFVIGSGVNIDLKQAAQHVAEAWLIFAQEAARLGAEGQEH